MEESTEQPGGEASGDQDKKDDAAKGASVARDTDATITKGTEELLSTAKWIITTFGAVGGALIAGISFSDLGKLDGTDQLLAALGAGLGIVGVVAIITIAAGILSTDLVALSDLASEEDDKFAQLRKDLDRNPMTHPGFKGVSSFTRRILDLTGDQVGARRRIEQAKDAGDTAAEQKARVDFAEAQSELKAFKPVVDRLRNTAQYEYLRHRFGVGRWLMSGCALLAAIGVGLFAFSNSAPKADAEPAVESQPVLATADLNDEAAERVQETIGPDCDPDDLNVVVLSTTAEQTEVIATGDGDKCNTARLGLEPDEVVIRSATDALDEEIFVP